MNRLSPQVKLLATALAIVIISGLMFVGCQGCSMEQVPRGQMTAQREFMDQGTDTIRAEHKEWTVELGPSGDKVLAPRGPGEVPTLTQEQVDRRLATHAAYEQYIADRKLADEQVKPNLFQQIFGGGKTATSSPSE